MIRTIYGDPERYKKSYFPVDFGGNLYLAGDGAMRGTLQPCSVCHPSRHAR